ncbi:MAG: c-type cytochrome [Burkholderiaceae bacterium]
MLKVLIAVCLSVYGNVYWNAISAATTNNADHATGAYEATTRTATLPGMQTPDMSERAKPCRVCHTKNPGSSHATYFPGIDGKPATYLFNQLRHFRDGRRQYEPMSHLLTHMDDAYLMALARHFAAGLPQAAQTRARPIATDDTQHSRSRAPDLVTRGNPDAGRPPCTACHGKNLMGDGVAVPPLLGLPPDYVNAQLGSWRNGTRHSTEPDCMASISKKLDPEQISAISTWLSEQALPSPGAPSAGRKNEIDPLPIRCGSVELRPTDLIADNHHQGQDRALARGQYIARAANCTGCHTAPGGRDYAGGLRIETPFGDIWSTNLTPDKNNGLGLWTAEQFWQAMHSGRSRDGRALSPAFPYQNYSGMTRSDSDALFSWLQSLAPVNQKNRPSEIQFPYNTDFALWLWRQIYFKPEAFKPKASQSPQFNRGAYLVEVLGHCSACHASRNLLGASASRQQFNGALMPSGRWYSPSLHEPAYAGLQRLEIAAIASLLKSGRAGGKAFSGPMAGIVHNSTQWLTDSDLTAMATYLKSVSSNTEPQALAFSPPDSEATTASRANNSASSTLLPTEGALLYERHCEDCHQANGRGTDAFPALAGNPSVLMRDSTNLITTILRGGYQPVTRDQPWPYGMPPFQQSLTNQELARLATFIRQSWGNRAPAISTTEVQRLR